MKILGRLALLATIAGLAGCPSGYRLVRTEGEGGILRPTYWQELQCTKQEIAKELPTDAHCAAWLWPRIHCSEAKHRVLCQGPPASPPLPDAACAGLKSLFSFVHMSDAQLKEHEIHMAGDLSEVQYDGLTNGALRDELLERHDDAVLLATMLGVNAMLGARPPGFDKAFGACPAPAPPRLAIHTGDAVDAGVFSELIQFLGAVEQLDIPFFDAVGNHDNLFFGTFPPEHMKGLNVVIPFVPIVDTDRFMRLHSQFASDYDLSLPRIVRQGHLPSTKGCTIHPAGTPCAAPDLGARSQFHGFDLACGPDWTGRAGELCTEARGYYAFDVQLPSEQRRRTLRFIVLNTAEIVPETVGSAFHRLSKGNMLPEQLRWLEAELDRPGEAETFALVFGHHNLGSFLEESQADRLRDLLTGHPRVLAYVSAHTHVDRFEKHPRPQGELWEIGAGSTFIYPQLARIMELLEGPRGELFLRVMSFRQQLGDGAKEISARPLPAPPPAQDACAPMRRDASFCSRLARRAQLGRFGAWRDKADDDWRDEEKALLHANALLPVYPGGGP